MKSNAELCANIRWRSAGFTGSTSRFWRALGVNNRLAEGMALHFFFMWLFAVNGVLYVGYTIFSGEWRVPRRGTLPEAWQVVLHDLRIRTEPLPRKKSTARNRSRTPRSC